MQLLRAGTILVLVCLTLIAVVPAFVGCSRSQEQVREVAAPVKVAEQEPVAATPAAVEAEEAPAVAEEPADPGETDPGRGRTPVRPETPTSPAEKPAAPGETDPGRGRTPVRPEKPPTSPAEKPADPGETDPGGARTPVGPEPPASPAERLADSAETDPGRGRTPVRPETPKGTVVVAKIEVVSNVPDPSSVPYDTCVTFIKYRVDSVESGQYEGKELLAVFWGMRDGKLQPAARFTAGQRQRLTIQPFAERKDLARVMQADDTNDYTLTPYWVVNYAGA